jgi:asparagine synthase (glutamine-hydrolysing)
MGGIGGIVNGIPNEDMLGQIKNVGQFVSPQACLFGSPQPVVGTLGLRAYTAVCDGELYNKEALVKELHPLGYRFADRSDAAVILHGYMAWGIGCLEKLEGTFAFALWDGEQLFLARDRMGCKPLLYTADAKALVFASSLQTILCHPGVTPVLTSEGVAELMLLGPYRTPGGGVLKGINELKPGHYMTYRTGSLPQVKCWWKLKAKAHTEDLAATVKKTRELLTDAIKHPAGVILSGEPESSVLASLTKSRETFTMGAVCTDELADALIPAMEVCGFPGMGDADAAFLVFCKKIRETTPAVLSCEGADAVFGGYPWFSDAELRNADAFPWNRSLKYRLSFIRSGAFANIDPVEYIRARYEETINAAHTLYDDGDDDKRVRQLTLLSIQWYLQPLLTRTERISNSLGLCVHMPFLDHKLAEYMYNVPWAFKYFGDSKKGLLGEAFKQTKINPPAAAIPNPALQRKLQDMMNDLFNTPNAPLFEIINRNRAEAPDSPQTLAYLLQINAWLERFSINISL